MIKKRKSYRVVAGSIRSELLRGLSRKICIGALAFSAAVVLLPGGKVGAYASDQTRVSSDESQVTVGYDDLDDTLQKGGLGVVVEHMPIPAAPRGEHGFLADPVKESGIRLLKRKPAFKRTPELRQRLCAHAEFAVHTGVNEYTERVHYFVGRSIVLHRAYLQYFSERFAVANAAVPFQVHNYHIWIITYSKRFRKA